MRELYHQFAMIDGRNELTFLVSDVPPQYQQGGTTAIALLIWQLVRPGYNILSPLNICGIYLGVVMYNPTKGEKVILATTSKRINEIIRWCDYDVVCRFRVIVKRMKTNNE